MIHVGGKIYTLVKENKNGYNFEAFRDRFSEVLERYDYIVGDWGYNQLRLKGFYKETNTKVNRDSTIVGLEDYLNEYCNFGCAYFIVEKVGSHGQDSDPVLDDQQDAVPKERVYREKVVRVSENRDKEARDKEGKGESKGQREHHKPRRHRFHKKDQKADGV